MTTKVITLFKRCFAAMMASAALPAAASRHELQLDAALSHYRYEEPGFMSLRGAQWGAGGRWIHRTADEFVLTAEARVTRGRLDYASRDTGSSSGERNTISDLRLLVGRRFDLGNYALQAAVGLGVRRLDNDSRGMVTSTGDSGYRRISRYDYIPLALDLQTRIFGVPLTFGGEYDYLIRGSQQSDLARETIRNRQARGHGLRLNVIVEQGRWAFGPYWQSWRIADSDEVSCNRGRSLCSEPANRTRDAGIVLRYRFPL